MQSAPPRTDTAVFEPTDTADQPFRTGTVVTIAAGHLIHDIFPSFWATLLPRFQEKLGLSLGEAGGLTALMQVPSLFNPLLGGLADRVRLRWLVVIAPALTTAAMCLAGLAESYLALAILLLVSGVGSTIWHVPAPVIVARASGKRVGQGMSFFMLGGELARTLGPIFAVIVVAEWDPLHWGLNWGLEGMYRLIPIGVAASVVLYWRTRDLATGPQGNGGMGFRREALRDLARLMVPIGGVMIARAFMVASLTAFLPTLLVNEGAGLSEGGTALAILELAGAAGALASGTISDRIGRRRVLVLALVASPLLMFVFLAAEGWLVVPALAALGFVAISPNPVLMALVQEHGREYPATANGLYMMVGFIGRSLIAVLVGAAGDVWGLRTAFAIGAVLGFGGLPFVWLLPKSLNGERRSA
jgi:MFS transporter, FSR family, fosmidomycin resistance protein